MKYTMAIIAMDVALAFFLRGLGFQSVEIIIISVACNVLYVLHGEPRR